MFIDVAKRAEAVGIAAVTLHARTAKQFYKGAADWSQIAALKRAVGIPVIGNGDLTDAREAYAKMRASGVDGVMLGRATLGNPWLVGALRALMEGREPAAMPAAPDRLRFADPPLSRDGRGVGRSARRSADAQAPGVLPQGVSGRERVARAADADRNRGRNAAHRGRNDPRARGGAARTRRRLVSAERQALFDETYENYRDYVNPPLARVMKLSGSPIEISAAGVVIVDHTGKSYLDFAGGYGVFTLGHRHPRVVAAVRAQLDRMALSRPHDVRPAGWTSGASGWPN